LIYRNQVTEAISRAASKVNLVDAITK